MNKLLTSDIVKMIQYMTKHIIVKEAYFCELDSAAGDGDFGTSLAKGFNHLKEMWDNLPQDDIGTFLRSCGIIITEYCGGASGPIWGSAFRSAGKYAAKKTELSLIELGELMLNTVNGIQKRGGAQLGDKTLLDALIPVTESLKKSGEAGEDLLEAMRKAAKEAALGAEKTKDIIASRGRASYVGERSLNHPDAGAMAVGILFTEIVEIFK